MADRSVLVPVTLSYLERRDAKDQTFWVDLHNCAPTVWPGTTKFTAVTCRGGHFPMGHMPISKRAGVKRLQRIKNFWTPLLTLIWF